MNLNSEDLIAKLGDKKCCIENPSEFCLVLKTLLMTITLEKKKNEDLTNKIAILNEEKSQIQKKFEDRISELENFYESDIFPKSPAPKTYNTEDVTEKTEGCANKRDNVKNESEPFISSVPKHVIKLKKLQSHVSTKDYKKEMKRMEQQKLSFERSKKDSEDLLAEKNKRIKDLNAECLKISVFVDNYFKKHSILKSIENLCDKVSTYTQSIKPNEELTNNEVADMEVTGAIDNRQANPNQDHLTDEIMKEYVAANSPVIDQLGIELLNLKDENSLLKTENSKLIEEKDKIVVTKNVELKKAQEKLRNQKVEIDSLKTSFKKYKLDTVTSLNNFTHYKAKMEKNAELHKENILSYINVIALKDKQIELLKKQHSDFN